MKKKVLSILFILLIALTITACNDSKQEEKSKTGNEEKIVKEEILEGIVDNYKFTVTEEITDRVRIQMNNGDIMLLVLSNKDTPKTIANFKKLVNEKFYDGLTFHRVSPGFVIQSGDPEGTGFGGSEENIKGEFNLNGVKNNISHVRGVISMARSSAYNSASSQFFIVHEDSLFLDGQYAGFGKVTKGIEIVDKICKETINIENAKSIDDILHVESIHLPSSHHDVNTNIRVCNQILEEIDKTIEPTLRLK